MHDAHAALEHEATEFRSWAKSFARDQLLGEWEVDYGRWPAAEEAFSRALAEVAAVEGWPPSALNSAAYLLARDQDREALARRLSANPGQLLAFSRWVLDSTQVEPQAKWQLAAALGDPEAPADNAEPLLARFANDADEYVRRRALQSLARHGSALVEDLASREWYSAAPDSPWTKMNALWALHRVKSARFDGYRAQALLSEDELLRSFAERLGVKPSG